ncbi:hypothetical protein [Phreatobacter sp. AB_2022a]|uniref:hypothetical protein n=1 Tax=Phreatobacter sp. AB_2022a TaxID=3003134 RepID=UPI00228768EC|nr:hypothetical protein [Phreatobacter sp. AB_2022a]MCZ0738797.1 hypothetical protein [Phreatobacter sp. AB_2022a]
MANILEPIMMHASPASAAMTAALPRESRAAPKRFEFPHDAWHGAATIPSPAGTARGIDQPNLRPASAPAA